MDRALASAPDVPLCAPGRRATGVVLARHSVRGEARESADSRTPDIEPHVA